MPEFVRLLHGVPAREVWEGELQFSSGWLADPTCLAHLGRVTGLELEHLGNEVRTQAGRADLLCHEAQQDGGLVVVECQFGTSDLDHVGRLLAYCLELGAVHGVLVAERISPEVRFLCAGHNSRWRAQCRLHAVEVGVVADADGGRGAYLRKARGGVPGNHLHGAELLSLSGDAGLERTSKEVVACLATAAPATDPVVGTQLAGTLASLPVCHANAKGGLTVALWPSTASPSELAATLGEVCQAQSATLLVLVPGMNAALERQLECLLGCVDRDLTVGVQQWRWQVLAGGGKLVAKFRAIDLQARLAGSASLERHRKRREFWRGLGLLVGRRSATKMRARTAMASSSWQLGYALGRTGFRLVTTHVQSRYCIDLRISSAEQGLVDNWYEQLHEHAAAIDDALATEFEVKWLRRGRQRVREAVVRAMWQRVVPFSHSTVASQVPGLARAVLKVEGVLLELVRDVKEFRW